MKYGAWGPHVFLILQGILKWVVNTCWRKKGERSEGTKKKEMRSIIHISPVKASEK